MNSLTVHLATLSAALMIVGVLVWEGVKWLM